MSDESRLWGRDYWDIRAMLSHQQDMVRLTIHEAERQATPRSTWSPWQRACDRGAMIPSQPSNDELAAFLLMAGCDPRGKCHPTYEEKP